MKVLITGASGMLGTACVDSFKKKGYDVIAAAKADLDVRNTQKVLEYVHLCRPCVIIHCAAYTNVDLAEVERADCLDVNYIGTRNVALAAESIGIPIVYFSTDYVFDGEKLSPYEVDDKPNPLSVYGESKLLGEAEVAKICSKHFILRTSWLYGSGGKNFIDTMLKLSNRMDLIRVVDDQQGAPTWVVDLAEKTTEILKTERYGIYHVTAQGRCTWAELAVFIFSYTGENVAIQKITSKEYGASALRPTNSVLSAKRLLEIDVNPIESWEVSVIKYIDARKENND